MRILAGGCRPAHPLFRGDSLRALNGAPFPVCFTKRVWQQLVVARHKNISRKAQRYAPRCSALVPPRHRPSQTHTSNAWPALCATRRRRHDWSLRAELFASTHDPSISPLGRGNHTFHHHNNIAPNGFLRQRKISLEACLFWSYGFLQNQ